MTIAIEPLNLKDRLHTHHTLALYLQFERNPVEHTRICLG
jgi:hypothetical protein